MRIVIFFVVVLVTVQHVAAGEPKDELARPVHIFVGDEPLDTGGKGYAAPFFEDFDGDSVRDLLVGEMADGTLRIYPNSGTNEQPKFDEFLLFHGGSNSGRIPAG